MENTPILNRQQLSSFLPNQEAVKAFESLFKYVSQTAPQVLDDVSAIIAAIKNPTSEINDLSNRLESLEQNQKQLKNQQSDIVQRLELLEQQIFKNKLSGDISERLKNLEALIGV